jgi:release factor glutamine methyltransferase
MTITHPATDNPFLNHVLQAAQRPILHAEFEASYLEHLAAVNSTQRWDFDGLTLMTPPKVYPVAPGSSSRMLIQSFAALELDHPQPGQRLLDVGCGSGAIALAAARADWQACAGDIQTECVDAARMNAQLNGIALDVRLSDLMDGFRGETFDVIVFNQPFFHPDHALAEECVLANPGGGLHVRFLREAREFLRPGGRVVFGFANCSDHRLFEQPGWDIRLKAFCFDGNVNFLRGFFVGVPR